MIIKTRQKQLFAFACGRPQENISVPKGNKQMALVGYFVGIVEEKQ